MVVFMSTSLIQYDIACLFILVNCNYSSVKCLFKSLPLLNWIICLPNYMLIVFLRYKFKVKSFLNHAPISSTTLSFLETLYLRIHNILHNFMKVFRVTNGNYLLIILPFLEMTIVFQRSRYLYP